MSRPLSHAYQAWAFAVMLHYHENVLVGPTGVEPVWYRLKADCICRFAKGPKMAGMNGNRTIAKGFKDPCATITPHPNENWLGLTDLHCRLTASETDVITTILNPKKLAPDRGTAPRYSD